MRIALDVDGVLADFIWSFSQVAVELGVLPERFPTSQHMEWSSFSDMPSVWQEVKSRWNWWMTLEPIATPEEVVALNRGIEQHDVYFVTSRVRTRGLSAEMQTRYWLAGIGVRVEHASVIATRAGTKGLLCKALDIEAVLEDCPDNLWDIWGHGITTIARRQPYNRNWGLRVENIKEFLEEIA